MIRHWQFIGILVINMMFLSSCRQELGSRDIGIRLVVVTVSRQENERQEPDSQTELSQADTPIPATETPIPPIASPVPTIPPTASPVPPTQPSFAVTRISPPMTRQTRGEVNLRGGPGTTYEEVGSVSANSTLQIIGESGDWYVISVNGRDVFIASWLTYELPTAIPTVQSSSNRSTSSTSQIQVRRFSSPLNKYTHGLVNLRSGPGTTYSQVGAVVAGATLQVLGQSSDWYLINHNGRDAYIASWLTFDAPLKQVSRSSTSSGSSSTGAGQQQQPVQQPAQQQPVQQPVQQQPSYACDCSKTCTKMASCQEAYFQLNNCGCRKRDGNNDGVPCESICR